MILVQQLKVLPAGSVFKIYDKNRPVLEGMLSVFDKSVYFEDVNDSLKYQKIYAGFHVELVDKGDDGIWVINL